MKRLILLIASLFIIIGCGGGGGDTPIKSGSFDKSFGIEGKSVNLNTIGAKSIKIVSIGEDSNHRLLLCGSKFDGSKYYPLLIRLNEDGTIDDTFANNGYFIYTNNRGRIIKIAVDGDFIYLAFNSDQDGNSYIIRLNQNGSIDTTFANNGFYKVDSWMLEDMEVQGDYIYYAYNYLTGTGFAVNLTKLNKNSFTKHSINLVDYFIDDFAIKNNAIYIVGTKNDDVFVKKIFTNNLNYDYSFGNNSEAIYDSGNQDNGYKIAIDGDDNLYMFDEQRDAAGHLEGRALIKFNNNGEFDTTFADSGEYSMPSFTALATKDNSLYVVAHKINYEEAYIIKLDNSGKKVSNFANDGTFTLKEDENDNYISIIYIDYQGRVVFAYNYDMSPSKTYIGRLNP